MKKIHVSLYNVWLYDTVVMFKFHNAAGVEHILASEEQPSRCAGQGRGWRSQPQCH